ncbi:hypothetical protein AMATHDRAFT_88064 [Amanita thiersii Skay4041]|uniref:Uncharacterized protein n=1 Tax=Amanita thiersii Skay4041 TaxID=703135 RepID=A0A2A9NBZ3_9AGAR|nr:hypothetical protein AMATHDRAFT_88064 [Amanita thiersii Skay4041]
MANNSFINAEPMGPNSGFQTTSLASRTYWMILSLGSVKATGGHTRSSPPAEFHQIDRCLDIMIERAGSFPFAIYYECRNLCPFQNLFWDKLLEHMERWGEFHFKGVVGGEPFSECDALNLRVLDMDCINPIPEFPFYSCPSLAHLSLFGSEVLNEFEEGDEVIPWEKLQSFACRGLRAPWSYKTWNVL